ncbi:hypothetical protein Acsp05_74120 [Actinokineospora sp. NBRC 105648]|nr:hypothetical protein Acsp05_74120 [Actinokineospora sp. NBRC 105648]
MVLLPISLALVGNMATDTVQIEEPWWQPTVWAVAGVMIATTMIVELRRSSDIPDLSRVLDDLASAVGRQWREEVRRREVNDPYPLPVTWEAADPTLFAAWTDITRLATNGVGWPNPGIRDGWAEDPAELSGDGDLISSWTRVPTGRLVVLGDPGSGKTMLLARLVLNLLAPECRRPGDPVPALVSVASWNPIEHDLRGWLAHRLALDHPALRHEVGRVTLARELLDRGLVVLLLDGFDEIPDAVRGQALAGINHALEAGQPLVLSSRTNAYRAATRPADGADITLAGAAGIRVRALAPTDVLRYLRSSSSGPKGETRWDDMESAMTTPGPLADAMTTPLAATLARVIYNPRPGEPLTAVPHPAELLTFPDRQSIDHHLFDGFIAAAYRPHPTRPSRWTPTQAGRALTYLARHLEHDHHGSPDLAWWRLSFRTGPPAERLVAQWLIGLGMSLAAGLLAFVFYIAFFDSLSLLLLTALNIAMTTGLAFGLVRWLTGRLDAAVITGLLVGIGGGLAANLGGDLTNGTRPPLDLILVAGLMTGLSSRSKPGSPRGLRAGVVVFLATVLSDRLAALPAVGVPAVVLALPPDQTFAYGLLAGLAVSVASAMARRGEPRSPGRAGPTRWAIAAFAVVLAVTTGVLTTNAAASGSTASFSDILDRALPLAQVAGAIVWLTLRDRMFAATGSRPRLRPWPLGALVTVVMALPLVGLQWPSHDGVLRGASSAVALGLLTTLIATVTALSGPGPIAVTRTSRSPLFWILASLLVLTNWFLLGEADALAALAMAIFVLWGIWSLPQQPTRGLLTSPAACGALCGLIYTTVYGSGYGAAVALFTSLAVELGRRLVGSTLPAQRLRWTVNGALLGILGGVSAGYTTMSLDYVPNAAVIGLPVAVVIALSFGMDAPRDLTLVQDPKRGLATDRRIFFTITAVIALMTGLLTTFISGLHVLDPGRGLLGALAYGLPIGMIIASGHTVWVRFATTSAWLAIRHELPPQLMRFLADAHMMHGVLRQNGSTYQFRHLELQRRLAAAGRSSTSDPL